MSCALDKPGKYPFAIPGSSGNGSIVQGRSGPRSDENEQNFRVPFFSTGESRLLHACAVHYRTGFVPAPGNRRGDFYARIRHSRWSRADLKPACWTCRPYWAPVEFRRVANNQPAERWRRPATSSKGGCEPLCQTHNPLPGRTGMAASRQVEKLYRRHTTVRRASEVCDTRKLGVPALEGSAVSPKKCLQANLRTRNGPAHSCYGDSLKPNTRLTLRRCGWNTPSENFPKFPPVAAFCRRGQRSAASFEGSL